jgi:microcystin-dependent protein
MATPFIGQIVLFPYNFAPRNFAFCQGQLLAIAQNTALFSLLGTTYGGNGTTTFALPDLRGRAPISSGQGPGLPNYSLGEQAGETNHTLITTEIPAHQHGLSCNADDATQGSPVSRYPATPNVAVGGGAVNAYASAANASMGATSSAGGSQPHNNMPPYLVLNYCIALTGIFPSRN